MVRQISIIDFVKICFIKIRFCYSYFTFTLACDFQIINMSTKGKMNLGENENNLFWKIVKESNGGKV